MVVKTSLSRLIIPRRCAMGPLRIPKDAMNVRLPNVKLSANFWGLTTIMGSPTKKANAKKSAERNNRAQNA